MLEPTETEIALSKVTARLSNKLDDLFLKIEQVEELVKRVAATSAPPARKAESGTSPATAKAAAA